MTKPSGKVKTVIQGRAITRVVDFTKLRDIPTKRIEAWLRHCRKHASDIHPSGHYRSYTFENLIAELHKRDDRNTGGKKGRAERIKQKKAAAQEHRSGRG